MNKIMDNFKKDSTKHVTGSGHSDPTETDLLVDFLVNQEEHTSNNLEAEREKEVVNRRLTEDIQQAALERIKTYNATEEEENDGK